MKGHKTAIKRSFSGATGPNMFESFQRHKQFLLLEWNLKKRKIPKMG